MSEIIIISVCSKIENQQSLKDSFMSRLFASEESSADKIESCSFDDISSEIANNTVSASLLIGRDLVSIELDELYSNRKNHNIVVTAKGSTDASSELVDSCFSCFIKSISTEVRSYSPSYKICAAVFSGDTDQTAYRRKIVAININGEEEIFDSEQTDLPALCLLAKEYAEMCCN